MKITVKLFATFRINREKIQTFDIKEETSAAEIIKILGIEMSEIAILLVNGKDGQIDKPLADGDVLALFPPVGGG